MVAYDPEHAVEAARGLWRRFGDRVLQRPGAGACGDGRWSSRVGALGLLAYKEDYCDHELLQEVVESVDGFKVLERLSRPARWRRRRCWSSARAGR